MSVLVKVKMNVILICLHSVLVFLEIVDSCKEKCPAKPKTPGPLVPCKNGDDIVRKGQPKLFSCCTKGFTNVSWFFQNENLSWIPVLPVEDKVQICNDGQSLQLISATVEDGGLYRSVMTNGSVEMSSYFRLQVRDCQSLFPKPVVTVPPTNMSANTGDKITFSCEVLFGCGDETFKTIEWWSNQDKNIEQFEAGKHYNYEYKLYNRRFGMQNIVGANLTINFVKKENFSQTYICNVDLLQFRVFILPIYVKAGFTREYIILTAFMALLAVVVAVVVVTCCKLHFAQISFWFKVKCYPNSRQGQFMYDTAVVCVDEDVATVRKTLLPHLRKHYKVYFSHDAGDMSAGRGETTGQTGMFPKVCCAIVFISSESLTEKQFNFICKTATSLIGGPYMILIKEADISKSAWKNTPCDLRRQLKVILTLTLPDAQTDENTVNKFWKSIKKKLPKQRINHEDPSHEQLLVSN